MSKLYAEIVASKAKMRYMEKRAMAAVTGCARCGKHLDRDLPLADKCTCNLKEG